MHQLIGKYNLEINIGTSVLPIWKKFKNKVMFSGIQPTYVIGSSTKDTTGNTRIIDAPSGFNCAVCESLNTELDSITYEDIQKLCSSEDNYSIQICSEEDKNVVIKFDAFFESISNKYKEGLKVEFDFNFKIVTEPEVIDSN